MWAALTKRMLQHNGWWSEKAETPADTYDSLMAIVSVLAESQHAYCLGQGSDAPALWQAIHTHFTQRSPFSTGLLLNGLNQIDPLQPLQAYMVAANGALALLREVTAGMTVHQLLDLWATTAAVTGLGTNPRFAGAAKDLARELSSPRAQVDRSALWEGFIACDRLAGPARPSNTALAASAGAFSCSLHRDAPSPACGRCDPKVRCKDCGVVGHGHSGFSGCKQHNKRRAVAAVASSGANTPTATFGVPLYCPPPFPSSWLVDSGASHHLTSSDKHLSHYRPGEMELTTAGGGSLLAAGSGQLEALQLRLRDVLHCPVAAFDLLSVGRLCDGGHKVIFTA